MGQRVQNCIDGDSVRKSREVIWICGSVRPFVRVAEVCVVIDDDDEPTFFVPNSLTLADKPILLVCNAAVVDVGKAWHLDDLVDVVEQVKDRMIARNIL